MKFHHQQNQSPENHDGATHLPDYSAGEVERLTSRAAELLDQLHDVMGEMAMRLQALSEGDTP